MIKKIAKFLFGDKKRGERSRDLEWDRFQKSGREQFEKLNKKGLNIPVITL